MIFDTPSVFVARLHENPERQFRATHGKDEKHFRHRLCSLFQAHKACGLGFGSGVFSEL